MSHYYATVQSGRKPVTKTGHKSTGMNAHIRTWDDGVEVEVTHKDGVDTFNIYRTTGSNRRGARYLINSFTQYNKAF